MYAASLMNKAYIAMAVSGSLMIYTPYTWSAENHHQSEIRCFRDIDFLDW